MRKFTIILTVLLALFLFIMPVLAATIDGIFTDWVGKAAVVDSGGVDDETSPEDSDITEYRADSDGSGLYVLMAWDDTGFNPSGSRAGITVKGADGNYYRIFSVMAGNPAVASIANVSVSSCGADPTCGTLTAVCSGASCTGAAIASTDTWADPFAGVPGHVSQDCSDNNPDCTLNDSAAELFVPWTFIGGMPNNGQFVFLTYGSYPSGPAQAPKDSSGSVGISCRNNNGTMVCYPSTPTAVDLVALKASSTASLSGWGLLLAAALVGILSAVIFRQRSGKAN